MIQQPLFDIPKINTTPPINKNQTDQLFLMSLITDQNQQFFIHDAITINTIPTKKSLWHKFRKKTTSITQIEAINTSLIREMDDCELDSEKIKTISQVINHLITENNATITPNQNSLIAYTNQVKHIYKQQTGQSLNLSVISLTEYMQQLFPKYAKL